MTTIGLDVGRNNACVAALDSFPDNVLRHYTEHRQSFIKIKPDSEGLQYLENLNPSQIVMEPTGVWYSAIWYEWARSKNIPVLWVGHAELAHQRGSYGFKNKRDPEDALSLACCAVDPRFVDRHGNPRFLRFDQNVVGQLRRLCLELEQLTKLRTQAVNQVRQRLTLEWPEASEMAMIPGPKGYSPIPGFIAGEKTHGAVVNRRKKSIAVAMGLDFSPYTIEHCKALVKLEQRITALEQTILETCLSPQLRPYYDALKDFGFGPGLIPLMITQVYPFDQFLVEGHPFVEWEQNHKGKWQKRDRSLRSFQAYLGLSFKLKQSGDKFSKKFSGSTLIRSHLYIWLVARMAGGGTQFRVDTPDGRKIQSKLTSLAAGGVTGSDKITRLLFYTSRLLWRKLLDSNL